ncbi:Ig-like domain-containing protein [Amphiplicatus metriothermophilus]|nr:G8 domain-containing protein [Amphiplicatus metriothermophilus]MBB5517852.1 hypothetical protein [Amphiplicatus metriothermophilus]
MKSRIGEAGLVAALLAIQGCKTLGDRDPDMVGPGGGEPPPPPPPPPPSSGEGYPVAEGSTTEIPVAELLAAAPGAAEIVEILSVENGTTMLHGSVVHFTPAPGYSGPANIAFSYRDQDGVLREARFEILVDNEAAGVAEPGGEGHDGDGHDGHDDHDEGGQGDDGHDHHGSGDDGHGHPHPDDPAKQAEHIALLNLVPAEEATHTAIKSGSWFDPATWANGEIPGDGAKVVIPAGVTVSYDGESPASIFTIRVDGELDFATDRDTFLEVDTLVVAPSGTLRIGTTENPVAPDVQAVISIADNGPIDVAWDPMLLSRGLISHGAVEIHGAQKDAFVRLAVDPMKGDTALVLESPPEGWRVGDKLVLTGTHLTPHGEAEYGEPYPGDTEDEELVIVAIDGNTVHVDRPLQYNHEGARDDLKAYVANYTRNIRVETENADGLPAHQRGHVMFMHSDDIDVRYAEFYELGRTDKAHRATEAGELDAIAPDSNVKGRYPLHIHRAGTGDLEDPAMIVGNAVWGSPGWGFVHHDSNAILADNAAYDVFGAAFVAELGTETGRWVHNIAIKSIGLNRGDKDGEDVLAFDLGRTGDGFWLQGRLVEVVDNVAAGMPGGKGFIFHHRAPPDFIHTLDPSAAPQDDKLRYLDVTDVNKANITQFSGNEVIAARGGLKVVKLHPQQHHDARSVIEDFTAWEVANGLSIEYTSRYTFIDLDFVATAAENFSVKPWTIGVAYGRNLFDMVVDGANIEGFVTGVQILNDATNDAIPIEDFGYFFIDVNVTNWKHADFNAHFGEVSAHHFLNRGDIIERSASYDSIFLDSIHQGPSHNDKPLELVGVKTDSLGEIATSFIWDPTKIGYLQLRGAIEQNGYWLTEDGRRVTLVEEFVADRLTGELQKVGIFFELPYSLDPYDPFYGKRFRTDIEYNGVLDLDSAAPVGVADQASVKAGSFVVIDVLANDFDPDGDEISLDGFEAGRGHIVATEDGKILYYADPHFEGEDTFYYWAEDEHGNFTKTPVTVTVEI